MKFPLRRLLEGLVLLAAVIFIHRFILHEGMRQMGGFDQSVMVDVAWRVFSGQRPHVDFVCPLPPLFYLGGAFAFKWLGVHWSSLIAAAAIFAWLSFLWLVGLLRGCRVPFFAGVILALFFVGTTLIMNGYWWFNQLATLCAVLFLLSCAALLGTPKSSAFFGSIVLSAALLALCKPNVAGIGLVIGAVGLMLSRERWRGMVAVGMGGLLALFILAINHISFFAMMRGYLDLAWRATGFLTPPSVVFLKAAGLHWPLGLVVDLSMATMIILLNMYACELFRWGQIHCRAFPLWRKWMVGLNEENRISFLVLSLGVLFLGLYSTVSNSDRMFNDLGYIEAAWLILWLLCGRYGEHRFSVSFSPTMLIFCLWLILLSCIFGLQRCRVAMIGKGVYFEPVLAARKVPTPFFSHFHSGETFVRVVEQARTVVAAHPGEKVFFGIRMEFLYAALGLPSPRHLPVWWDPRASYSIRKWSELMDAWRASRFDLIVCHKNETALDLGWGLKPSFDAVLRSDYVRDDSYPDLTVFYRRKEGEVPSR